MRSRIKMQKNYTLPLLLSIVILVTMFLGCGGGTSGTGGMTVEGSVQSFQGKSLAGVSVIVLESGDSSVTDTNGLFSIPTTRRDTLTLSIESSRAIASTQVTEIPEDAVTVRVRLTLQSDERGVARREVEIERRAPKATATPRSEATARPTATPRVVGTSSSLPQPAPTQESNDSDGSGDDDSDKRTPNPTSTSRSGDDSDDDDHGSGSNKTPTPQVTTSPRATEGSDDNSDLEDNARGAISQVSSTSITVNGLQFTINSRTELKDEDGRRTSISSFSVGEQVKVQGKYSGTTLVAVKIEKQ